MCWYALAVHARQEKAACRELTQRGIEVFLPTAFTRRQWSDRVQRIELALFPGYLFVRVALSAARRVELLRARHTVDLVGRLPGDDRVARAIPEIEIESIRKIVLSRREMDPVDALMTGTPVVVVAGPLRGARGVVETAPDGRRRLAVQISLLGRGVRTLLSADDVLETA